MVAVGADDVGDGLWMIDAAGVVAVGDDGAVVVVGPGELRKIECKFVLMKLEVEAFDIFVDFVRTQAWV